jgi:type II secretory pathway pseudopilin PulG
LLNTCVDLLLLKIHDCHAALDLNAHKKISMKSLTPHRMRLAGFSLVEMAIVILIAGIMMGAGLSLLAVKQEAAKWDATQKHQEVIKQALINYLGKNKRLPCPVDPASPITGIEGRSATVALPPCISYSGVVPYAELGLERAVALDGYENFIDYVVSPPTVPPPSAPPFNAWLYAYNTAPASCIPASSCLNTPSTTFWPSNTAGSLTANGNSTTSGVVVALISHGKNGFGAVNIKGGKNDSSTAGTDEAQNINPISGALSNTVVKRDASDSTTGNGAFDDIVMILSVNDLTGPLIANGTFQSAQAVLAQANNIVLGYIVAHQNVCPITSGANGDGCVSPAYYYSTPATLSPPAGVTDLGVQYNQSHSSVSTTSPSVPAYTLDVGDGNPKSVSVDDLRGILTKGVGFY